MNLRDLEAFVAVATYLNYSTAARKCYISQPTLSQRVSGLEKELGVKLFERNSRKVELTEKGKQILLYAKNALESVDQINRTIRELTSDNTIKIAMADFVTDYSVFDISSKTLAFKKQHPLISVDIYEMAPPDCMDQLIAGEVDFAIIPNYAFVELEHDLEALVVQKCRLMVATGNKECKTLEEVLEKTIFVLENFPGSKMVNDVIVPKLKSINPNVRFQTENATGFIESMIFSEEYSSMIPEIYANKKYPPQIGCFSHEKFDLEVLFSVIYKKEKKRNPNTKSFLDFMKN